MQSTAAPPTETAAAPPATIATTATTTAASQTTTASAATARTTRFDWARGATRRAEMSRKSVRVRRPGCNAVQRQQQQQQWTTEQVPIAYATPIDVASMLLMGAFPVVEAQAMPVYPAVTPLPVPAPAPAPAPAPLLPPFGAGLSVSFSGLSLHPSQACTSAPASASASAAAKGPQKEPFSAFADLTTVLYLLDLLEANPRLPLGLTDAQRLSAFLFRYQDDPDSVPLRHRIMAVMLQCSLALSNKRVLLDARAGSALVLAAKAVRTCTHFQDLTTDQRLELLQTLRILRNLAWNQGLANRLAEALDPHWVQALLIASNRRRGRGIRIEADGVEGEGEGKGEEGDRVILKDLTEVSRELLGSLAATDRFEKTILIHQDVTVLVELLLHRLTITRLAALERLAELASTNEVNRMDILSADAIPWLVRLLQHEEREVRLQSLVVFGALAVEPQINASIVAADVLPWLVQMLKDKTSVCRAWSAFVLANLAFNNPPCCEAISLAGAVPLLVELLRDPSAEVREDCVLALGNLAIHEVSHAVILSIEGALQNLVTLLEDSTAEIRERAAFALGNLAAEAETKASIIAVGAVPLLVRLLRDPSVHTSEQCIRALGNLAFGNAAVSKTIVQAGAIAQLELLTFSASATVRELAVWFIGGLVQLQDDISCSLRPQIPILAYLISDPTPEVRSLALEALGHLANLPANLEAILATDAINQLFVRLDDPSSTIRKEAARILRLMALPTNPSPAADDRPDATGCQQPVPSHRQVCV